MSNIRNVNIAAQNTASVDSFGKWRVSQTSSQISVKQIYDKFPLYVDEVINGTATSIHNAVEASTTLSTQNIGDYVILQTKRRGHYDNAKSQEIYWTYRNFGAEFQIIKRVGYFTSDTTGDYSTGFDGFFIESSDTTHTLKVYKSGTLTASRDRTLWDDPLDGTGKSGIDFGTLNLNIIQNLDFEWLGYGNIRFFFVCRGMKINFHTFDFTNGGYGGVVNEPNFVGVYMSSPHKPLRWEIRQVGVGSGEMVVTCSTVGSEGDIVNRTSGYGTNNGITDLDADVAGVLYAALGVRLKSTMLDTEVLLLDSTFNATTNDDFYYEVWLNPTVAGTFTFSDDEGSLQTAWGSTANTVTGGTRLQTGMLEGGNSYKVTLENDFKLGSKINGDRDIIVICIRPKSSGLNVFTTLNWGEKI